MPLVRFARHRSDRARAGPPVALAEAETHDLQIFSLVLTSAISQLAEAESYNGKKERRRTEPGPYSDCSFYPALAGSSFRGRKVCRHSREE